MSTDEIYLAVLGALVALVIVIFLYSMGSALVEIDKADRLFKEVDGYLRKIRRKNTRD